MLFEKGLNAFAKRIHPINLHSLTWAETFCYLSPFTTQSRLVMTLEEKAFKNIVGKGENAGNQKICRLVKSY